MFDISKNSSPENIYNNFIRCGSIHSYNTGTSTSRMNLLSNFYRNFLEPVWNCLPLEIRRLSRTAFKQNVWDLLFQIFEVEDSYVDTPTLLDKIAKQQL